MVTVEKKINDQRPNPIGRGLKVTEGEREKGRMGAANLPSLARQATDAIRIPRNFFIKSPGIMFLLLLPKSLSTWNEAAKSTSGGPMLPLGLDVLADDGPTPIKDVTILTPPPPAFFRLHIRSAEN